MDIYELINTFALNSFAFRHSRARQILANMYNELQHAVDAQRLSDEVLLIARAEPTM